MAFGACGCAVLPLSVKTEKRPMSETPYVSAQLAGEVTVTNRRVSFSVDVTNRSQSFVVIKVPELELHAGPRRVPVEKFTADDDTDGRDEVILQPGSTRTIGFSADVQPLEPMRLHFGSGVIRSSGVEHLSTLELIGPRAPIARVQPSVVHLEVKALGGALIGPGLAAPLIPEATRVLGASGFIEASLVFLLGRAQLAIEARAGNGRIAGLELGLQPFTDWLTFGLGYGVWFVTLEGSPVPEGQRFFGHGPWASVDVSFDEAGGPFGFRWPRRFGVFVTGGPAWVLAPGVPPLLIGNVEAGLRWRFL